MLSRRLPPVVTSLSVRSFGRAFRASFEVGDAARDALRALLLEMMNGREVQLTDSGTSALRLALQLAFPTGSLIAIPAFGCIDVAAAVQGAGCRAIAYDLDPTTLAPDLLSVERAMADGARGLIASHLFGYAIPMHDVQTLCNARGCIFIEDAAQAFGARSHHSAAGAVGDFSVMSFGRGKGIGGGGGGALIARGSGATIPPHPSSAGHRRTALEVRTLAIAAITQTLTYPAVYGIPASMSFLHLGEMVYHPSHVPQSIGRAAASLAADGLRDLSAGRTRRSEIAVRLVRAADSGGRCIPVLPDPQSVPGWLRVPMLLRDGKESDPMLGVYRAYPQVVAEQKDISDCVEWSDAPILGARELARRLVTLPCHSRLSERDVVRLEQWLTDCPQPHPKT